MIRPKKYLNFSSSWIALSIFIVVTLFYLHPVFHNFSYWGIDDWDHALSHTGIARKTILTYHQIPLWKPYHLGGNALLAAYGNGLSLFSPFFIFVLLFGTVSGLKLQAIAYLVVGMFGMFLLGKQLNLKRYSLYLPVFVFMLSSFYALHFTAGALGCWDFIWLPWVFLYYLRCLKNFRMKYLILCSLFLCLMLLSGEAYPVLFAILFLGLYSIVKIMRRRKLLSLKILPLTLVITLLLGAVKLLPGLELQKEFTRLTFLDKELLSEAKISRPFPYLSQVLLNRKQALTDERNFWRTPPFPVLPGWHWYEYGAYIGLIPLFLFLVGIGIGFKRYTELIIIGFIFLILSLGNYPPLNFWKILHSLPIFNNMRSPSRFIIMFNFILAIIAGVTLSRLEEMGNDLKIAGLKTWVKRGIFCLVLLVLVDLITVNSRIFKDAFVIPPLRIEERTDNFYQTYDITAYRSRYTSLLGSLYDMYPAFLKNKGIINAYDNTPRPQSALSKNFLFYRGESFLLNDKGSSSIIYFSPNVVKIEVNVQENDILVLNQNYDIGWKVKGTKSNRVISPKGLASAIVTPEDHLVTFYYLPTSFIVGTIITLLTVVIILLYRYKKLNKRYFKYSIFLLFTIFFLYLTFGIKYFAGASPENRSLILARQYEWNKKYSQAAKEYEKVIQTYPYYAEGYRCLGYCYLKEKRPDKAMKVIMQAIKLQPTEWSNYNLLGTSYYDKKEYDQAIIALKEAIRLQPMFWSSHNLLGASYFQKKEYDKAIEALKEALRRQPDAWSNYNNLGKVYLEIKDYDKAIQTYEKALYFNLDGPDSEEILYNLLLVLQKCGRFDETIKAFYQGRTPLSHYPGIIDNLARLLATAPQTDLRDGSWALLLAKRACEATEYRNPRFLDTLAAAYAETGQFEEAIQAAHEAIEKALVNKQEPLAEEIRKRLEMYQAHQPYREPI